MNAPTFASALRAPRRGPLLATRNAIDLGSYAPAFRVLVDGKELDPTTNSDVTDINVTLEKDKPAGFTINVNDWDDQRVYGAGTAGSKSNAVTKYSSSEAFDPGRTITIELGYAGDLQRVVTGPVTSLSVRFPESGSPTLTVGGQDQLREIAKRKPTAKERKLWRNVADWQVVEEIAGRLGLAVHADHSGPVLPEIVIRNTDYATFLLERAAGIDFEVYVDLEVPPHLPGNPAKAAAASTGKPTLFFVARRDGRKSADSAALRFTWGANEVIEAGKGGNLLSFSTRLSTSQAVRSVTVRGWDSDQKKAIVFTADRSHLPKPAAGEHSGVTLAGEHSTEVIIDRTFKSADEAKEFAIAELMRRSNTVLTGSAKIIGTAGLRPGMIVSISGLGPRFDGDRYQVSKVTHSIGSGGFLTEFEVEVAGTGKPADAATLRAKLGVKPSTASGKGTTPRGAPTPRSGR